MIATTGVLGRISHLVFLVRGSPNHESAKHVALANVGYDAAVDSDLQSVWMLGEPGFDVEDSVSDHLQRLQLVRLFRKAAAAYVTGDTEAFNAISSDDAIATSLFGASDQTRVHRIRFQYVVGNSRLMMVFGSVSFENKYVLGTYSLLTIWCKDEESWKLLTVTQDPVSLKAAKEQLPRLIDGLNDDDLPNPKPAKLVSPADGVCPVPMLGERFGSFVWESQEEQDSSFRIAEFHHGRASRLFVEPKPSISAGRLWSVKDPWKWRVWTIGHNGAVSFSGQRVFED